MIAQPRLQAFALFCLVAAGIPCLAEPPQGKELELLKLDDLTVRLRYPITASLADERWLGLEFENQGTSAIEIDQVSYGIERECFDPDSGELKVSGGLGQGHGRDLFPDEPTIRIPPGKRSSFDHTANYAATLLGLPPKTGFDVRAKVRIQVRLKDGRFVQSKTTDPGEFRFRWQYPTEEDVAAMQMRLKQMLANPTNHHATGYMLGTLLGIPDVAQSITVDDLVAALPARADEPFSGRDAILKHLNEHHHASPVLIRYILKHLEAGNPRFVKDQLIRLRDTWDERFLEPLLALFREHPYLQWYVLNHLAHHGLPRDDDQNLARQLGDVLYRDGVVKRLNQQRLDNPQPIMQNLSLTRDRRFAADLAPFLRDRRKIKQYNNAAWLPPPMRVCDAAMHAILTILDGKDADGGTIKTLGVDEDEIDKARDELIARLEERLAKLPDVAASLPQRPDLDAKTQALSDRWKDELDPRDFLQLKQVVKPGTTEEAVRQILGQPIEVTRSEDAARWLYLRPSFRASNGAFHRLVLDKQGKVTGWEVEPWNDLYDPETAPPSKRGTVAAPRDLGTWDDVFAVDSLDDVVVRRGAELFLVPLATGTPKRIGTFPQVSEARILKGLQGHGGLWLFCTSPASAPFLIDAIRGKVVEFTIEGVQVPGSNTGEIQSHVITADGTLIAMIAGGDRATWPRSGNRPVYFWADLKTGKSRQFPIGWDLDYFSPDQTVAVFNTPAGPQAVQTSTAEAAAVFDRREAVSVPFNWTNTDSARPLIDGDRNFVGITAGGTPRLFGLTLADPYIPSAQTRGEWAALHMRGYGSPRVAGGLWFARLEANVRPQQVARDVGDFEVLGDSLCVFTARVAGTDADPETFVYDARRKSVWSILDGVDGLRGGPSNSRLIAGFGAAQNRLVLCDCSCYRFGSRDPRDRWRRWVILDAGGQRCLVESMPEEIERGMASHVWLHDSSTLVFTTEQVTTKDFRDVRRLQLKAAGIDCR